MSANSFVLKRGFDGLLVAAALVAVGLIVGILVIMPKAGTLPTAVVAEAESSIQRARDAATARYAAMDAFYGAATGDNLLRSRDASAARYQAVGAFYTAKAESDLLRATEADAARYGAMDAFYGATTGDNLLRSTDASAARYTAMGEYYAAAE